jgi:hypothetical protein
MSPRRGRRGVDSPDLRAELPTVSRVPKICKMGIGVPREKQRLLAISIPKPRITRQLTRPRSKRVLRGTLSESTGRRD